MKNWQTIFSAVYVRDATDRNVEHFARAIPYHLFEWNVFNNGCIAGNAIIPELRGGWAFDFDGIICQDPSFQHGDDNEDDVIEWLENVSPKYLPRLVIVPLVVSFRLEKHRPIIQRWLDRWGVKVKRLVLHPASSFKERDSNFNVACHKGMTYRDSTCSLFFESEDSQARVIADTARKPVIVPDSGKAYLPGVLV